jgi:hypothetical protein
VVHRVASADVAVGVEGRVVGLMRAARKGPVDSTECLGVRLRQHRRAVVLWVVLLPLVLILVPASVARRRGRCRCRLRRAALSHEQLVVLARVCVPSAAIDMLPVVHLRAAAVVGALILVRRGPTRVRDVGVVVVLSVPVVGHDGDGDGGPQRDVWAEWCCYVWYPAAATSSCTGAMRAEQAGSMRSATQD